jgi:hypothetical protein
MRTTLDGLNISVVVRRVWIGAAPFGWEMRRADAAAPIYVSPDRFRSMHEAYRAGQATLADFLSNRSMLAGMAEKRERQSDQVSPSLYEARA